MIHTSLAPTVSGRDIRRAASLLLGMTRAGDARETLERKLSEHLGGRSVVALDSGRNALRSALEMLGVGAGDEVLLQAYTCVSVPGPVLWVGARPTYVDIRQETFTMDPADLERKITPRSRAVVMQHTFGLPADISELLAIARRHGLAVIEDCAHALGARYQSRPVGVFGDAAIFSFGRDKVISSVFGGALAVSDEYAARLRARTARLSAPSRHWTARQLLHPLAMGVVRPTYAAGGRYILRGLQVAGMLSKALTPQEKQGAPPALPPSLLPDALARLVLEQLARLPDFLSHRHMIAKHYTESLQHVQGIALPVIPADRTHGFLRYTIRVSHPLSLHVTARRAGIILGDWYDAVVAPSDTNLDAVGYLPGSCPTAEEASRQSVNLPTSPTLTLPQANRVLESVFRALHARGAAAPATEQA